MDCINLTPLERSALLEFLREYLNSENLSVYQSCFTKHLFLAYLKLEKAEKEWQEAMAHTD